MTGNGSKGKHHVTETPDVSHIKNTDVTYEHSDVSVGGILKFIIGLLVMGVAVQLLTWGMFRALEAQEKKNDPDPRPMALTEKERLPPEPRLQGAPGYVVEGRSLELKEPEAELKVVQEKWKEVLEKGPVDEKGQRYGMPIEEAKKRIVEQGSLPVRKQ
jgi:hypothetical protein